MEYTDLEKRAEIEVRIARFLADQIEYATTYFGYPEVPVNNDLSILGISGIAKLHLNNAGDPWIQGNARMHTKIFEQEVLAMVADLYQISPEHWGYITSGGTEGNLYGIYLAREYFQNRNQSYIFFYSEASHYSVPKNAKLLNLSHEVIRTTPSGEMDYADLSRRIEMCLKRAGTSLGLIINLNIGTTMTGAIDNLAKVNHVLQENHIDKENVIIHADAALMGFIYPFTKQYQDLFKGGVNSLAISGHKFLGAIHPCGIFLTRKETHQVAFGEQWISYVGTRDTTISGSRNGFLALNLWYLLSQKGMEGYRKEALTCIKNAKYLYRKLKQMNWPGVGYFPDQTIVTFKKPSDVLVRKYQLATQKDLAHVVVMQHVTKNALDKFCQELENEII